MLTALIAEDELLVRIGIASCVPWEELGIVLTGEAEDGEEAWRLYEKHHPDILIADIRMPGMSGTELLRRIREKDSHCAAIIITNVEADDELEEVRRLGISEVLLKASMNKEDISRAVERISRSMQHGDDSNVSVRTVRNDWQTLLFDQTEPVLPFQAKGITAIRLFPGDGLTPALKKSLTGLITHRMGNPEAFAPVSCSDCLLFVWKKKENRQESASPEKLTELARYIRDNFRVDIGIVNVCDERTGSRPGLMARRAAAFLQQPRLFDGCILTVCPEGSYRSEYPAAVRPEIRKVMDYIADHYAEELPLEQVSGMVNYQNTYFSRLFKTETGCSYSDYVFRVRILRALELLGAKDLQIGEIAKKCGFSDISYFSMRFRQLCGMTPREWRDNYSEG